MRKTFILALAAVSLSITAVLGQPEQTNVIHQLDIHLVGIKQGRITTNWSGVRILGLKSVGTPVGGQVIRTNVTFVKVDNRDIIAALGSATGNTFSNKSRLVLITPATGGDSSIAVQTGSNSVDVTGFFILEQLSDVVSSSQRNTSTGRSSSTDYSIQRLVLQDNGDQTLSLHFDVRGLIVETSASPQPIGFGGIVGGQTGVTTTASSAPAILEASPAIGFWRSGGGVAGAGDKNGVFMVLQGTVSIHGKGPEGGPVRIY